MTNLPPGIPRQEMVEDFIRRNGKLDLTIVWQRQAYPRPGRRAPWIAAYWQRLYEQRARETGTVR